MNILYESLFQVELRHTYYADQNAREVMVVPTAECRKLLTRYGLIFRSAGSSFVVAAEVEFGSDPPELRRSLGSEPLVFRFLLRLANPALLIGTELPEGDRHRRLFYFDNLREDRQDGRRYLGDSVADRRFGEPIRGAVRTNYSYRFSAPVQSATLQLHDRFDNLIWNTSFDFSSSGDEVEEFPVDLGRIDRLRPGRYVLSDSHGGRESFFYDPSLFGRDPLAVIEIYSTTEPLTPDGADRVPSEYRFVEDDEITGRGRYALEFTPRATTWRYTVTKLYENNGIDLEDLAISGGISFSKSSAADQIVFTSDAPVTLHEEAQTLRLRHNSTTIRKLPTPGITTPLEKPSAPGPYLSNTYIYV